MIIADCLNENKIHFLQQGLDIDQCFLLYKSFVLLIADCLNTQQSASLIAKVKATGQGKGQSKARQGQGKGKASQGKGQGEAKGKAWGYTSSDVCIQT